MSDGYDSDSDYNENEKNLLNKYRKSNYQSDDEEPEGVFNILSDGAESDNDDDEDMLVNSDIEGQEEDDDDIPHEKAWGRNKKAYYSSDYVNPNTYNEKELQFGEFEAEEAKKLEGEVWQEMFGMGVKDVDDDEDDSDLDEEAVNPEKKDEDKLSNLIEDYKEFSEIYNSFLKPVKEKFKSREIESSPLTEFVQNFSDLILNYNTNIMMFLLLKSEGISTQDHPVLVRLRQYQNLIEKLRAVFDGVVKSQIEVLLEQEVSSAQEMTKAPEPKKKKLKLLQNLVVDEPVETQKKKKGEKIPKEQTVQFNEEDEIHEIANDIDMEQETTEPETLSKRPITYQMAKNKGLTPHRKKEQRNPRVKHRNKYRKAQIRRKGAVRDVRHETHRYGGEISGINTHVLKGIKLKV
ncbi:something about silencing protein 10 [Harmonia axyridis]|uniref:something about silencing protein 10 n=1 Tax=Harmonia axyridis TaxID=115357 RepID=UPI001E2771AF|nr:something about silencing protein 10 [Harmonia axyridis]